MPPKKNQKMSLNDFLADESTGKTSWADEMDDLPTAPMPRESSYRRGGDFLSTVPDRAERDRADPASFERPERSYPPREELPLPSKPPFTAFIGNLSYDVTESEIADYFAPHKTVSVRIVTSQDGKPKGFGYVEFETLDGLKDSLDKNGSQLANRTIRVSVAEAPKSSAERGGFSSIADETSQWRRSGPLPSAPDAPPRGNYGARSERSGFNRSDTGTSGFDNMDVSAGARSGFGSKFQPSAPPRAPREPVEPSQGDVASDWRTGKPVEGPPSRRPSGMGPQVEGRTHSFRKSDATDVDERFTSQERMGFGSKFSPTATPPESPSNAKKGFGFGAGERRGSGPQGAPVASASDAVNNWRSAARKPTSNSPAPATAGAPAERKKLELKKRSNDTSAVSAGPSSSKPSPFGNAKPVDATEREKQIEEKLAQKEKERQEELKAKKEKIRAEKEKEKAEKALASGADGAKDDVQEKKTASAAATDAKSNAPSKPRSTPPTGAWGGGRKPAGALLAEQAAKKAAEEAEKAEKAEKADKATANGATKGTSESDSDVKQVAADLEKTSIDA